MSDRQNHQDNSIQHTSRKGRRRRNIRRSSPCSFQQQCVFEWYDRILCVRLFDRNEKLKWTNESYYYSSTSTTPLCSVSAVVGTGEVYWNGMKRSNVDVIGVRQRCEEKRMELMRGMDDGSDGRLVIVLHLHAADHVDVTEEDSTTGDVATTISTISNVSCQFWHQRRGLQENLSAQRQLCNQPVRQLRLRLLGGGCKNSTPVKAAPLQQRQLSSTTTSLQKKMSNNGGSKTDREMMNTKRQLGPSDNMYGGLYTYSDDDDDDDDDGAGEEHLYDEEYYEEGEEEDWDSLEELILTQRSRLSHHSSIHDESDDDNASVGSQTSVLSNTPSLHHGKTDHAIRRIKIQYECELGRGAFGIVYKAIDVGTGEIMAVKEAKLDAAAEDGRGSHDGDEADQSSTLKSLQHEFRHLATLSHPNVVRVYNFVIEDPRKLSTPTRSAARGRGGGGGGGPSTARIFMEYAAKGSVRNLMKSYSAKKQDCNGGNVNSPPDGAIDEDIAKRVIFQAILGIAYLHSHHILHRDLKPDNLLVDALGTVKLSDFGTCRETIHGTSGTQTNVVGTVAFMSPESVQGHFSTKSDIWALGATYVNLVTGRLPWSEQHFTQSVQLVFHVGSAKPPVHYPRYPKSLSVESKHFLQACFAYNPKDRPSANQLIRFPLFADLGYVPGKLLYLPHSFHSQRPNAPAKEVHDHHHQHSRLHYDGTDDSSCSEHEEDDISEYFDEIDGDDDHDEGEDHIEDVRHHPQLTQHQLWRHEHNDHRHHTDLYHHRDNLGDPRHMQEHQPQSLMNRGSNNPHQRQQSDPSSGLFSPYHAR